MSANKRDNNLLIDFESSATKSSFETENIASTSSTSQIRNGNELSNCASNNDSMARLQSSIPMYKFLISESFATVDFTENNPFDTMDKQAGLLDDPFEIVENAALVVSNKTTHKFIVETGELISIDKANANNLSRSTNMKSFSNDLFNMSESPLSRIQEPCGDDLSNAISSPNDECGGILKNANNKTTEVSVHKQIKQTSDNQTVADCFGSNMSTPLSRNVTKAKSSSLNLLKFSLSNNRVDSVPDTVSPIFSDDNLSGDEFASALQQKLISSNTLMLRTSSTDDSFDDLSATKPNWIDSETDVEIESDIDSDIANLNIPMLNTDITAGSLIEIKNDDKAKSANSCSTVLSRDKLLEKLASIKLKIPSPPLTSKSEINAENANINSDSNCTNKGVDVMIDEKLHTPKNQYSFIPFQHKEAEHENPNQLIEDLKKIVDQCDDKCKQQEANTLLQSLCSILKLEIKKKQDHHVKRHDHTPPQPIVRQGTFSIEKSDKNDKSDVEKSKNKDNYKSNENVKAEETENIPADSALSEVIKNLQNVLGGGNQNINVLQTNRSQIVQAADGALGTANPTYIVVMGTSSNDIYQTYQETPKSNVNHQAYRSQSLSTKEKPLAAIRATQAKADQIQKKLNESASVFQTPTRRPTLTRRSSFGAITRQSSPNNNNAAMDGSSIAPPKANIVRRRSIQSPPSGSSLRPPSPKGTEIKSSIPPLTRTSSMPVRRKSLVNVTTAKDSPQKMKSSYGIIKKPSAPPAARNLKIRVKESFAGRSAAPLRAVVPMNRVAPLMMINESVSPIDDKRRRSLITSTLRSLNPQTQSTVKGTPAACSTPTTVTLNKTLLKDKTYLPVTPSTKPMFDNTHISIPKIGRRRSLSDYRVGGSSANSVGTNSMNATLTVNNVNCNKFAPTKLTKIGIQKTFSGLTRSKENKNPK